VGHYTTTQPSLLLSTTMGFPDQVGAEHALAAGVEALAVHQGKQRHG